MRSALIALLLLPGCSLVLSDPIEFQTPTVKDATVRDDARVVGDAEMRRDAFLPRDAFVRDATPVDAEVLVPDAAMDATIELDAEIVDAEALDAETLDAELLDAALDSDGALDAALDAALEADAGHLDPCDGVDNDNDGEVDEDFAEACLPCARPGEHGVCAVGAIICSGGMLTCVPWLPADAVGVACDLLDNDCDGLVDEADEHPIVAPGSGQAFELCGPPRHLIPDDPLAPCGLEPRVVGCASAHACLAPDCIAACEAARAEATVACEAACEAPNDLVVAMCTGACLEAAAAERFECIGRCEPGVVSGVEIWTCADADDGPICVATECPPGTVSEGRECVPEG